MFETTILCSTDIDDILRAAEVRKENDRKYATHLLETLMAAARASNLKQRFWEAVYDRRSSRFLLHQLHIMQSYGALTYNVEDIINEYDVLERLAVACGKKIVSNYAINGSNLNVYLEFVPELQSAVLPTTSDELEERRLEKETSW
jgi:hypothetical protein